MTTRRRADADAETKHSWDRIRIGIRMQSDRFQAEVAAGAAAVVVLDVAAVAACKRTSFVFVFINEKWTESAQPEQGNLSARPACLAWTPRTAAIKGSGSADATAATVCDVVG